MIGHEVLDTEVLIIGGGGAASRAALEAAKLGVQVVLVDKGRFGSSGSTAYGVAEVAGFNAADGIVDPEDNPEEHYNDIMQAGLRTCNPSLARIVAEEANTALSDLEEMGVTFEQDLSGKYVEVRGCFASRPRMHIIRGHGVPILKALSKKLHSSGVSILNHTMAIDLIVEDGMCFGALCINQTNKILLIRSKITIMATGGAGDLFKNTLNPVRTTGDGYAMGFLAGAKLVNMEFMQAGIGIVRPFKSLLSAWMWEAVPRLQNSALENVLKQYVPEGIHEGEAIRQKSRHMPFSTRDISRYVDIAVKQEALKAKDSPEVFLDFSGSWEYIQTLPLDADIRKMWSVTAQWMLEKGLDPRNQLVPVTTFGHAINGGLLIDEHGETSVKNLFAVGEAAGGPHGADRLGGNMLVTCQVFGARAGRRAAQKVHNMNSAQTLVPNANKSVERLLDKFSSNMDGDDGSEVKVLKDRLQTLVWENYLVIKDANTLGKLESELLSLEKAFEKAKIPLVQAAFELRNLIITAQLVVKAAMIREESRGSHYRADHPTLKGQWEKGIILNSNHGQIEASFVRY